MYVKINKLNLLLVTFLAIVVTCASNVGYSETMFPTSLIISATGQPNSAGPDGKAGPSFARACPVLAAAFGSGTPAFGFAPFSSVKCQTARPVTRNIGLWNLHIATNLLGTKFEMYDLTKREPTLVVSYFLPLTTKVFEAMYNQPAAQAIAWRILREMPFLGLVSAETVKSATSLFADIGNLPPLAYNTPLVIYVRLPSVDPSVFQVRVVGSAKFVSAVNTRAEWSFKPVTRFVPKVNDMFFVHSADYDPSSLERLSESLHPLTKPFEQAFYNLAASGYFGLRYGRSLTKGESLLTSDLLGFFFESRGGLISGFRFNHDRAPIKNVNTSSSESSFGWSRTQVGLGFGRNLDVPLISWIDVMPRIGVTSLTLKKRDLANEDLSYSMIVNNALCTGIEIGIENRATKFLIRGWGLINYSLSSKLAKTTSVFQYRAGLDVFRDAGDISKYIKFKGLGFITYESNTLKNTSKVKSANSVEELRFPNLYLGLGTVLAW